MSYKTYTVALYPGSRPNGLPQFGSEKEKEHYLTAIEPFRSLKGFVDLHMLGAFHAELTEQEVEELELNPLVRFVERARPRVQAQITQTAGWALASLGDRVADEKYTYYSTGEGVDIYIVDSGIDTSLTEFAGGLERVYDKNPDLAVHCDHGAACAACAAGKQGGVAKKARILDVKVDNAGDCLIWGTEGLNAVLAHHTTRPAIASLSFGGTNNEQAEADAITALIAEGVICIASAGNEAVDTDHYPSDRCISVGAYGEDNVVCDFSNFGDKVHFFSPGLLVDSIDKNGSFLSFSGTSASCPFVAGIAATLLEDSIVPLNQAEMLAKLIDICEVDGVTHALAATTTRAIRASKPITWNGTVGAAITPFTEVLAKLDFRKDYKLVFSTIESNGDETAITDAEFRTVRYADAAITVSVGGPFNRLLGALDYKTLKVTPGDTPSSEGGLSGGGSSGGGGGGGGGGAIVPIAPGAIVPLYTTTITPEELITLSISLSVSSGNANFSTTKETSYEVKDPIILQGLSCLVERIKPSFGPGKEYGIECVVMSELTAEYISMAHYYAEDGVFRSVHELIQELAEKAGATVTVAMPDVKVQDFVQAGKFIDVLASLAGLIFGTVVQQNGTWHITHADSMIGDFTIENVATATYARAIQSDVPINAVMSLLSELLSALLDKDKIEKELEDLKEELEKAKEVEDEEEEAGKVTEGGIVEAQFLSNINIRFGRINSHWQQIDSAYEIDALTWEYWTPEAGKSINPDNPAKEYYAVQEVRDDSGEYTGEMRGLEKLGICSIKIEIQEPSNFGGIYYVKGRSLNFMNGISMELWTIPTVETETKLNTTTHQFEKTTYLVFSPKSSRFDPAVAELAEDDEQLYLLDIEVRYMPSITVAWKFSGTLAFEYWPVKASTGYTGRIDRDGNFYDPSGRQVTTVDALDEIPGNPTNETCILNQAGELCGIGQNSRFIGLNEGHGGVYNSTTHDIRSTTATTGELLGWVAGDLPASHVWPGLGDTSDLDDDIGIYFSSEMPGGSGIDFTGYDPEHPELWDPSVDPADELKQKTIDELEIKVSEKENELLTVNVRIAYLEHELTSYGAASLIPLVHAVAQATIAVQDELERQQKLGVKNFNLIKTKQSALSTANNALYAALSALKLESVEVTCSFLYNNLLPLPQNVVSITGDYFTEDDLIINSVNLQLSSKTVSVTATRRIA